MAINVYTPGVGLNGYKQFNPTIFNDFIIPLRDGSNPYYFIGIPWVLPAFIAAGWEDPRPYRAGAGESAGNYAFNDTFYGDYTGPENLSVSYQPNNIGPDAAPYEPWVYYPGILVFGRGPELVDLVNNTKNTLVDNLNIETLKQKQYITKSLFDFELDVHSVSTWHARPDAPADSQYSNGYLYLIPGEEVVPASEFDRQFLNHLIDNHGQRVVYKEDSAFYLEGPEL